MNDPGNFTSAAVSPLPADLPAAQHSASRAGFCDILHASHFGADQLFHSSISRQDVISCIWIDRTPAQPDSIDPDFDIAPLNDYVM